MYAYIGVVLGVNVGIYLQFVTELDHLVGSVTNKPPVWVTNRNLQKVTY